MYYLVNLVIPHWNHNQFHCHCYYHYHCHCYCHCHFYEDYFKDVFINVTFGINHDFLTFSSSIICGLLISASSSSSDEFKFIPNCCAIKSKLFLNSSFLSHKQQIKNLHYIFLQCTFIKYIDIYIFGLNIIIKLLLLQFSVSFSLAII